MPLRTPLPAWRAGLAAAAVLAAGPLAAADGNPDLAFWGDGRYTASAAPDEVYVGDLIEAPDGALVWAGGRRIGAPPEYVARWRRLTDAVESGCDLALPPGEDAIFASADFDASGRLVLAGWVRLADDSFRPLFARYVYPSCALDPGFDLDGVVKLDVGATDTAWVAALEADGDALAFAGSVLFTGASNRDGLVGRLLPDGAPDPGFSSDGWRALDGRAGDDALTALALAPGGRLYAGGSGTLPDGTDADFYLFALQESGAPVPGFGLDGLVRVDFGATAGDPADAVNDLALAPDGRVVLAGSAVLDVAPGYGGALAVVTPSGALDAGFGSGGRLTDAWRGSYQAVAVQGNGRLVLAGIDFPSDRYYVSARRPNGDPDASFAGGAAVPIEFPEGGFHALEAVALQAGRVVVGGLLERSAEPDLGAVARLGNAYVFADGFEIGSSWFWSAAVP